MKKETIIKVLEYCKVGWCVRDGCLFYKEDESTYELSKNALALIKELTEDNEMLEAEIQLRDMLISDASNRIEEIRTDTVREMQTRFKELMGGEFASCGYCNAVGYWSVKAVKDNIDRIANEILNENTEE